MHANATGAFYPRVLLLAALTITAAAHAIDAPLPQYIDLADAPGAEGTPLSRIYGPQEQSVFGLHPHSAAFGDFNADGYDDLLIGSANYDRGGNHAGAAFIFFGKEDGLPTEIDLAATLPDPAITVLYGDEADGRFGGTVAAGDFNGDGYDDAIIAAWRSLAGAGEIFVIYGEPNIAGAIFDLNTGGILSSAGETRLRGASADEYSGLALATADINGDGFDEIISGAPSANYNLTSPGRVDILYGNASWPNTIATISTSAASVFGSVDLSALGSYVDCGDFNGDGYIDILATAPNAYAGYACIIYGSPGTATGSISLTDPVIWPFVTRITGAVSQGLMGTAAAAVDLNNDGYCDIALGVPHQNTSAGQYAGAVSIFFGNATLRGANLTVADPAIDPSQALLYGDVEEGFLGNALAAGDIDGNGVDDLVMASPQPIPGSGEHPGAVYVLYPPEDLPGQVIDFNTTRPNVELHGYDALRLGNAVATGADCNGDGFGDFVAVSRLGENPNLPAGNLAGFAALVYGGNPAETNPINLRQTADGDVPFQHFGGRLSPVARAGIGFTGGSSGFVYCSLYREPGALSGLVPPEQEDSLPPAAWRLVTTRTGWTEARVEFGYLPAELPDGVFEYNLALYQSDFPNGPWSEVADGDLDTQRNTMTVKTTTLGYFTLASAAPVLVLEGAEEIQHECHTPWVDPGFTAYDIDDGDITVGVGITGFVDPDTPGQYTLNYEANDSFGYTVNRSRTVTVVDTTAPEITMAGQTNTFSECAAPYADAGATANDACDGTLPVTTTGTVDIHTPGLYPIQYDAQDSAGNHSTETRQVTVDDTLAPALALNGQASITIPCGTPWTDTDRAAALDNCDGDLTANVNTVNPVDVNTPGTYSVIYYVTDSHGNTAIPVSRLVTVAPCGGEGEGEGETGIHSGDQNADHLISISELLRVIQFFNSGGFHCQAGTEDGFTPGPGADHTCDPHSSDYNTQDWQISLSELLRLIQFFNSGGYHTCPGTEDGYCVGL